MSNPAPTLNQINAFNATQGTTIDFNIIGGTEVIRSNKIYIYDLSDNSLICTHLYVSTESIHELPPNTSSSIVYASGKSSADFTNNTQYYAQIQTFTDTSGTQGASGLSIAKLFWCLPTPTLTLGTIPTTISTTSYNVSATYTDTSASVVSNIIQQYQFNLYNATGSLLQSSGVVVGSGTQQGTSDVYDISYNFTGLNVSNSYYVTVEVTTTQGMSVSAQSNTFIVSIDTPTLGEATVVNNACDGYISVTSNLSGEYGGSASGEIASFVTNSINNVSSLKVSLDPLQDLHGYDKPWVGGAGKNKFNESSVEFGKWTQSDGTVITAYYACVGAKIPVSGGATVYSKQFGSVASYSKSIVQYDANDNFIVRNHSTNGATPQSVTLEANTAYIKVQISAQLNETIDATMLASYKEIVTIGVEPTTYEPYSNICPITGWTGCEVDVAGVNLLDPKPYSGLGYNVAAGTDVNLSEASVVVTQNEDGLSFPVSVNWGMFAFRTKPLKSGTYRIYIKSENTYSRITMYVVTTDGKTRDVGYNLSGTGTINTTKTVNEGEYIVVSSGLSVAGTQTMINPQIEIGSTATAYQPYNPNSAVYPVSWQTEAGTVYGGTVDVVSGVLTVTWGYTNLGVLNYSKSSSPQRFEATTTIPNAKAPISSSVALNGLCTEYKIYSIDAYSGQDSAVYMSTTGLLRIYDSSRYSLSASDFKTAMNNVYLAYELATPITYQLDPVQVACLLGQNNVWADCGDVEITYNIPITNLLVKRQDVADVSGAWLTLYSQPITQASDMDFTFIDFTNQYGKTYKYALVPLLTQIQSGVEVEIEGGYTVSDNVDSIFDGVYIADQTNVERVKAGVGYGNVDMNQGVGSITPIGSKYPIVITNSQNQYHNGSIRGTIVPNDFYSNGNLSRIDMVNKRDELEQFLTNKRAKIIKDWNGKMWLVMIMSNVACSFDDNYGMGMVSFSADWLEVGDPTNQQDLYNAGLINVGGV